MRRFVPFAILLGSISSCHRPRPAPVVTEEASLTPPARIRLPPAEQPVWTGKTGRSHVVRSILNLRDAMAYGDSDWNEKGVPAGDTWLLVDLEAQTLSLFQSDHEVATAVTLFGVDGMPTPTGKFNILAKLKDHESSSYDAKMPYTLRLTNDGIAIHASEVVEGTGTHGCVGIPIDFAKRLFDRVKLGDDVLIVAKTRDFIGEKQAASKRAAVG